MGIKDNPNLYYTTPVYHMPIDNNGNIISEIEENRTVTPEKDQQVVSTFSDGAAVAQVTVEPIPDDYVNIADSTLDSSAQLLQGVIAYKRDGTRIEGTMSRSGGDIDPSNLNYDDTAVPGYYVSEVDEVNGIIDVKRAALPEIPTNVSDLNNDAGYISSASLPERVSAAGFITLAEVPPISAEDKAEIISEVEASIEPPTMDAATEQRIIEQVTADLNIPDSTSDLTNDSGFITRNDIPAIPTAVSDLTNDAHYVSYAGENITLAFDGTYNATTNPAATVSTVTTAVNNINVPNSTSDLTNDSGFITSADVPTTVAELSDSASYATKTYVDNAIAAIPGGGGSSSGDIPTYNRQDSDVGGYLLYSGYSADRASDSLYKSRDLSISNNSSSTTLYLGNATDGTQSQRGIIALQGNTTNSQNYYNSLVSAGLTANVTNTLPSSSGTLLNTNNTSVTQAQDSGVEIGTINIDQTSTKLYAPAALSNYTNDVGYVTASEVPSVGIMAIPISYNSSTGKYETTFTTADIQRLDFPVVSFNNQYYYLDHIDEAVGELAFINAVKYMRRITANNSTIIYGFKIILVEDTQTGTTTERITPLRNETSI